MSFSGGKVTLMLDCEPSGIDGAKEALWYFAEQKLDIRLAWSPAMHASAYAERRPESLRPDEIEAVLVARTDQ